MGSGNQDRRPDQPYGRAIRGGVPISFPWFAAKADDPKAPAHGFVRTTAWTLESIERVGDAVTVSMSTQNNEHTKKWWPADFLLVHRATFDSELTMELEVRNTGANPLQFEEALTPISEWGKSTGRGCTVFCLAVCGQN